MAEFPFKEYAKAKDNELFQTYMTGVGNGILWVNSLIKAEGKKPMFCIPSELVFSNEFILSLLDQEVQRRSKQDKEYWIRFKIKINENLDEVPLELILINGFIVRYPCEQKETGISTKKSKKKSQ
jgi:hypothetical protein